MTRCPHCNHCFRNLLLRTWCPKCQQRLKDYPEAPSKDDSPDVTGFVVGLATGLPISPTHGVTGAALLGAALHSSSTPAQADEPTKSSDSFSAGGGDFGGGGSSASYDSGSSSSDSGSSGSSD